ncbi:bifunctional precorrin-2 dehydrogenase/sirohydrochlorin ferrochelatase [Thalassomonas sp. M1454]|uniref:precorrin-2 dehydrogenase/sirohydrochlorin ferrochelatase family protein n=1 Tax=Thalassomonas sp. M1454 TaxID=2594477 RepID=UPI00163D5885|nr:NAD(P)-dependent oxidoreductase [Thalassomonas sp. M1454]
MDYFPIFLDAKKLNTVVVGGGNVAARKIELLLKTPAKITIVSPELKASVKALLNNPQVCWQQALYNKAVLANKQLVIAATNIEAINQQICTDANELGMLINVVDDPARCNYITPAIIDRSPMIIAMSSSGNAPILLQMLKSKIDLMLPSGYGKLATFCGKHRLKIQNAISQFSQRKAFWQNALEGEIAKQVLAGNEDKAEQLLINNIATTSAMPTGSLTLIKVFNQNPDNLSLIAYQKLQQADTIFIAQGIDNNYFDYGRRDAAKHQMIDKQLIEQLINQNQQVVIVGNEQEHFKTSSLALTTIICGKTVE